jgi:hypothetical protein
MAARPARSGSADGFLLLFLAVPAPAGVLERVLSAMAKIESAHCTGWFTSYVNEDPDGQLVPGRMRVEWWYAAPHHYRKSMGPKVPGWNREPGTLLVRGEQGVFVSQYGSGTRRYRKVPLPLLEQWLTPLDFFSQYSILERARREKRARVSTQEGVYNGRPVKIIAVEVVQPDSRGALRQRWVLHVDPASDRIIRSNLRQDWRREGSAWNMEEEETLEDFEYDVDIDPARFEVKLPRQSEPQPGTSGVRPDRPSVEKQLPHPKDQR